MGKAAMQRKLLCRVYGEGNTTSMTMACYPEDGNLKAEGSARLQVSVQLWKPAHRNTERLGQY